MLLNVIICSSGLTKFYVLLTLPSLMCCIALWLIFLSLLNVHYMMCFLFFNFSTAL